LTAAVSGYLSIAWLLRFLRTRATTPFVVYRVALGLLLVGGVAAGYLH
jgi:undecaprenyl-diphosphatase